MPDLEYLKENLKKFEDGRKLLRHAERVGALWAAYKSRKRRSKLRAAKIQLLSANAILDKQGWPIWVLCALVTNTLPADPSNPLAILAFMAGEGREFIETACDLLDLPVMTGGIEPVIDCRQLLLDTRRQIRESRPYFAVCGPPPNPSASYHDQGTTAHRGRALYFFRGRA